MKDTFLQQTVFLHFREGVFYLFRNHPNRLHCLIVRRIYLNV